MDPAPAPADSFRQHDPFQLLVDSVHDYAIFMLDPDGYVRTWNSGAERIKGYRASEIIGQHFSTFYLPADIRRGKPEYELRVAAEEGRWEEQGWRLRADGALFWANVIITAIRDQTGALVGFAKVTRDLTERKRAEEERELLLQAEHQARMAAEAANARLGAIQALTEAGFSELAQGPLLSALLPHVAAMLEVDTVAVLLLDGEHLVPVATVGLDEEVRQGIRIPVGAGFAGRVVAEGQPVIVDSVDHYAVFNPLLRDRGLRSLLGVPLRFSGVIGGVLHVGSLHQRRFTTDDAEFLQLAADRLALAVAHTRLVESEQIARAKAAAADAASRAREQFLGIAAHELRTPLTIVKGYALLLKRAVEHESVDWSQVHAAVTEIDAQSDRLSSLVDDLLEISRVQEGRLTINRAEFDLADLVDDVVRRFTDGPESSALHRIVAETSRPLLGAWDRTRLDQAVSNLVSNAIKYSPEGGSVYVTATGDPRSVTIEVRDSGLGIPADKLDGLFQPFVRIENSGHAIAGMGIGLFLTRQFVEAHGGTVSVESTAGQGSTFRLRLPRHSPAAPGEVVAQDG